MVLGWVFVIVWRNSGCKRRLCNQNDTNKSLKRDLSNSLETKRVFFWLDVMLKPKGTNKCGVYATFEFWQVHLFYLFLFLFSKKKKKILRLKTMGFIFFFFSFQKRKKKIYGLKRWANKNLYGASYVTKEKFEKEQKK